MFRVIARGLVIGSFHTRYEAERFAAAIAHGTRHTPTVEFHESECPAGIAARVGAFKCAA